MFWLVSLPGDQDETWRALQRATGNVLSRNFRFELPMSLRVGSLDALMTLSDDLSRVNATVESVVNKIRRQACELAPDQVLQVNGQSTVSYLTNFTWDEAKYPLRKPLKDIVSELNEVVVSVDDEMKVSWIERFG
jgi:V-type H+-transporting ATPase subunit C